MVDLAAHFFDVLCIMVPIGLSRPGIGMMLSTLLRVGLTTFGQGCPYYYSKSDNKLSVKDDTFLSYLHDLWSKRLKWRDERRSTVSVLTIFKVGFPGAILFMILKPMANIMDILEIRWNSKRSIIILIFFQTQTNMKLSMKMLKSVKI